MDILTFVLVLSGIVGTVFILHQRFTDKPHHTSNKSTTSELAAEARLLEAANAAAELRDINRERTEAAREQRIVNKERRDREAAREDETPLGAWVYEVLAPLGMNPELLLQDEMPAEFRALLPLVSGYVQGHGGIPAVLKQITDSLSSPPKPERDGYI